MNGIKIRVLRTSLSYKASKHNPNKVAKLLEDMIESIFVILSRTTATKASIWPIILIIYSKYYGSCLTVDNRM